MVSDHRREISVDPNIVEVLIKGELIAEEESKTKDHTCLMDRCLWNNSELAVSNAIDLKLVDVKAVDDLKLPSVKSNEESREIIRGVASACGEYVPVLRVFSTSVGSEIDLIKHRLPPELIVRFGELDVIYCGV